MLRSLLLFLNLILGRNFHLSSPIQIVLEKRRGRVKVFVSHTLHHFDDGLLLEVNKTILTQVKLQEVLVGEHARKGKFEIVTSSCEIIHGNHDPAKPFLFISQPLVTQPQAHKLDSLKARQVA